MHRCIFNVWGFFLIASEIDSKEEILIACNVLSLKNSGLYYEMTFISKDSHFEIIIYSTLKCNNFNSLLGVNNSKMGSLEWEVF